MLYKRTSLLVILIIVMAVMILPIIITANPIPSPVIMLNSEDIGIVVRKLGNNIVNVCVRGVYLFTNEGFKEITMYFPIPKEVDPDHIKIYLNDIIIENWSIVDKGYINGYEFKYETLLGVLPMIEFLVKDIGVREDFNVTVIYEYNITLKDDMYKTVYALGTGRFGYYYSKQPIVHVKIEFIGLQDYELELLLASPSYLGGGVTSYKIKLKDYSEEVELDRRNIQLVEDLVIVLKKPGMNFTENRWVQGSPTKVFIETGYYRKHNGLYDFNITIKMIFNHLGYRVEWNELVFINNSFKVYTKVFEWTGPSAQAFTEKTNTYSIKDVPPGEYTIEVYVNNLLFNKTTIKLPNPTSSTTNQTAGNSSKESNIMENMNIYNIVIPLVVLAIVLLILFLAKHKYFH